MSFSKDNIPTSPDQYWAKESEDGKPFVATVRKSSVSLITRFPENMAWGSLDNFDWLWGDRVEYTAKPDWCKIVTVGEDSVLFYVEPDSDNPVDDLNLLHQAFHHKGGLCADVKISGLDSDASKIVDYLAATY